MTTEELNKLKENSNIRFIYKIPNSLYNEKYEYIIIGDNPDIKADNVRTFSCDDWFIRMRAGSLLPYVCATLPRSGKIKEFINIYDKPNIITLRSFINAKVISETELIQECLWGEQLIKEGKVNRMDVFKNNPSFTDALNGFYEAVDPIYKMWKESNV